MTQDSTAEAIKDHMKKLSYLFGKTPAQTEAAFFAAIGRQRALDYRKRARARHEKGAPISLLYSALNDAKEANLLFSEQAEAELAAFAWISKRVVENVGDGGRVLEMGPGTGVLLSWLRLTRPDLQLAGAEREPNFRKMAIDVCGEGVTLLDWDYDHPAPEGTCEFDVLITAFGIDFSPRASFVDDSIGAEVALDLRRLPDYSIYRENAQAKLQNWRAVAVDGAKLFAILRLPGLAEFLAVSDAAAEAGWSIDLPSSEILKVGREQFPALQFVASRTESPSTEDLIAWWAQSALRTYFDEDLTGAAALSMFSAIQGKPHARFARRYDDGHTMLWEIGRSGAMAYLMQRATTGYVSLRLSASTDLSAFEEVGAALGTPVVL